MVGNTLLTSPWKDPEGMTDWPAEWGIAGEAHDAWAVDERQPQGLHVYPQGSAIIRRQILFVRI